MAITAFHHRPQQQSEILSKGGGGLPPHEIIGWLTATGLLAERIWKLFQDYGKNRHDQTSVDADSLFKRAMDLIDRQGKEIAELKVENGRLWARIWELESNATGGRPRPAKE